VTESSLSSILRGGNRRSLDRANNVVTLILNQPARFPELIECLWRDDAVIRMRAADAAEKSSAQKPQLLRPFKAELLGLAAEASRPELRWHLALMIPLLPLTPADRKRAQLHCKNLRSARADGSGTERSTDSIPGLEPHRTGFPHRNSSHESARQEVTSATSELARVSQTLPRAAMWARLLRWPPFGSGFCKTSEPQGAAQDG
jgi:hypothetical protein